MNSQNEPFGREYVISYVLNDYQKGSLVARFDGQPSTAQMKSFLAGYSLSSSEIKEVTARPAATVSIQSPRSANPTIQTNRAQPSAASGTSMSDFRQQLDKLNNRKSGKSRGKTPAKTKNSIAGFIFSVIVALIVILLGLFA
ncbi:hypothetical protein [Corynebacterium lubricantis]|uniref:hypothetical protein n=1 Tax=Corynebacterium lubricantis TaxID=541095 RepID=UPI00036D0B69|nr:hypothetical protein [Corynebacterium lubricantis]